MIAEELRIQTAQVARIDGAVSGTPFLIALVPGTSPTSGRKGVMERRIAALYGSRPAHARDLRADPGAARRAPDGRCRRARALLKVRDVPLPEKPTARRPLRIWVRSIYVLLIFGGFLSAPSDASDEGAHWRMKAAVGFVIGGAIWVDHLGVARQLHDRHGLGLREPRPKASAAAR